MTLNPNLRFGFSLILISILLSIFYVLMPRPSQFQEIVKNVSSDGTSPTNIRYGIIVDAGSTQTRLYIYEWQGPSNASISPHVKPMHEHSTGHQARLIKDGGIADMKPSELPDFFKDMIKYAKHQIPEEKHANTLIYILATAGVRLLERSKRVKVVDTLTEFLSEHSPFKLDRNLGVQVLPGEFEGAFDWLTVNYLAGTLRKESVQESLVSIDMGGASLELTFEPTDTLVDGSFPLRVNGTDRILYTQSYLKYGRNQALHRYRQSLVSKYKSTKKDQVEDPCFPEGYFETANYDMYKKKIQFVGTGDYELCRILTRELLREAKFCPAAPCAMNGHYQPDLPSKRPIIAIDGFAKLAEWLDCPKQSSLNCLEQSAISKCTKPTSSQSDLEASQGPQQTMCFLAAYTTNVLKHGFRIEPSHPIRFADDDLDGTSMGWTLGAMIFILEMLSFNNGDCGIPDSPGLFI